MPSSDPDSELAQFLERHPWPEDLRAQGTPTDKLASFELDATPRELWPFVSDTSRFNRALGLTEMNFEERDGVVYGTSKNAGVLNEWVEEPWTWVAERGLSSVRRYSRGFAHSVRGIYELVPLKGKRTRFNVYFGFVPRGYWQKLVLVYAFNTILRDYEGLAQELVAHVRKARETPYFTPAPSLSPEAESRMSDLSRSLEDVGVDEAVAKRLLALVRESDEMDLYRIRALPLARQWKLDDASVLGAFLHATRAGLLQLSWDVVCPHCRGVRAEVSTLGEVPRRGACDVCEIDFDTDSENAIEVAFHVHPSIRRVPDQLFCSAEPAKKQHMKVQQRVEAGEKRAVKTALGPGRYRLRVVGEKSFALLDVDRECEIKKLSWRAGETMADGKTAPAPRVVLENPGDEACTFVIEDAHWSDDALRPARLFSFQDFRDLFTEEFVGSDVQLSVGQQTILFTDVVGSTQLYADRGDPGAFVEVKRHFTEIYDEVRSHQGAIVKTIGDAAMAAFVDPVRALSAARGVMLRLHEKRGEIGIVVRASLNSGPCIAVKLNTNIDYFGSTVNAAAKLQACAGACEIALPRKLADQPAVRAYLAEVGAELDAVPFSSPALGGDAEVVRWRVIDAEDGKAPADADPAAAASARA